MERDSAQSCLVPQLFVGSEKMRLAVSSVYFSYCQILLAQLNLKSERLPFNWRYAWATPLRWLAVFAPSRDLVRMPLLWRSLSLALLPSLCSITLRFTRPIFDNTSGNGDFINTLSTLLLSKASFLSRRFE
jgi:hypothetical protein